MTALRVTAGAAFLAVLGACAGDESGIHCAQGKMLRDGACVAITYTCGEGTRLEGSACVAVDGAGTATTCGFGTWIDGTVCRPISSGPQITCGPGTHLAGTTCVQDATGGITCGTGTHLEGTVCTRDPSMTCGPGTRLEGSSCVADDVVACGPGTHEDAGRCVRDASTTFELRIAATRVNADGYSKIPVLVLGRNADGSPSTADVILWASRPGAGTFSPTLFRLGALGTTSYFVPCTHANVGCTGPVELRLALASDPETVVATAGPLELVAPEGVGSPAPCLGGGNVLFFDGSGYVFTGTQTVTLGTFSATGAADKDAVSFWIEPSDPGQGSWWHVDFNTRQLGLPLATQVYEGAQRAPFASPGHPGIDIGGDGRGCNTISGRFQVHELEWTGAALTRFTATFEQFCEANPSNVLRGCVHFEP
jgi:prepilin-type processing-associated H-X9-DG protein